MGMDPKRLFKRLKKAARSIVRMTYLGLKDMFSGLFSRPKKFFIFIALLIALVLVSYHVSLFLWLVPLFLFYMALFNGRNAWERKKKRPVGRIGTVIIFLISVLMVTPLTFGYFVYETSSIEAARIPRSMIEPRSDNGWEASDDPELTFSRTEQMGLVRIESRFYEYPTDTSPPYPGFVLVSTIKSVPVTSVQPFTDDTINKVEDKLEETILEFEYEGLVIDRGSKVTGKRTIKDGHDTRYFEYAGKIETTPDDPQLGRFVGGGKLKVRGETWACEGSGTIVSAVGVAQYGYTFEPGTFGYGSSFAQRDYPDDYRTWVTTKNLISNVVCD